MNGQLDGISFLLSLTMITSSWKFVRSILGTDHRDQRSDRGCTRPTWKSAIVMASKHVSNPVHPDFFKIVREACS